MFGDALPPRTRITIGSPFYAASDLPLVDRRLKVEDNNKAFPVHRVFFTYRHFHNSVEAGTNTFTAYMDSVSSLDRYKIGFEKTYCGGVRSVEFRMLFNNAYDF